ncbi:TPM domain-containing protein [Galbibacter sp. EGI 63066]|uniref:TPM domain-containing protein n=1 Tax=Galbibacter sp. EGI 63066 TaxID=2993559 RepID=UPI0022495750|nr:TPM domain-containing protein [Galbibacter sp. EGI 63066]MCX2681446.1 TPM domain-containing protein [Galbibacter sp. EGI 63066]
MKTGKVILTLILALSLVSYKGSAQKKETKISTPEFDFSETEKNKFPEPVGYVNDFEELFTAEQKNELEKSISDYENETTREIAIVTVNSIAPYDNIADFATDLSNKWGVGKAMIDNGLVIVFSKSLRKIRISTGNGTEKILTDEICKNILDQTIIPEFKKGKYYSGIEKGLAELIDKWDGY